MVDEFNIPWSIFTGSFITSYVLILYEHTVRRSKMSKTCYTTHRIKGLNHVEIKKVNNKFKWLSIEEPNPLSSGMFCSKRQLKFAIAMLESALDLLIKEEK
jgi:hypothetical protein